MQRDLFMLWILLNYSWSEQGELVYVNYARTEDFFTLERDMKINCSGKIVIARYGKVFRGNKVKIFSFLSPPGPRVVIQYSSASVQNHPLKTF
jgi:hypothetical protein